MVREPQALAVGDVVRNPLHVRICCMIMIITTTRDWTSAKLASREHSVSLEGMYIIEAGPASYHI